MSGLMTVVYVDGAADLTATTTTKMIPATTIVVRMMAGTSVKDVSKTEDATTLQVRVLETADLVDTETIILRETETLEDLEEEAEEAQVLTEVTAMGVVTEVAEVGTIHTESKIDGNAFRKTFVFFSLLLCIP